MCKVCLLMCGFLLDEKERSLPIQNFEVAQPMLLKIGLEVLFGSFFISMRKVRLSIIS